MTIQFQCTLADYKEANRGHSRARMGKRRLFSLVPGLLAILYGVLVFAGSSHSFPASPTSQPVLQSPHEAMMNLLLWVFVAAFFLAIALLASGKMRKRFVDVSRPSKRWLSPAALAWLGAALFLLFYLLNGSMDGAPGQSRADQIFNFWFLVFLWVALVVFLYFAVFRKLLGRRWAMQQNMQRPKTMDYSPERISIEDELITTSYRWHAFVRAIETENLFLLYPSELTFHMIPKRAFPSTAAVDGFRRLIQEWAGGQSVGFPVIPASTPAQSPEMNH